MPTIPKKELAKRISQKTGLNNKQTLEVIQLFMDTITEELSKGNRLELRDFAIFQPTTRKPRTALNPKTLEKVDVPAKRVVKFKMGRVMKQKVQNE